MIKNLLEQVRKYKLSAPESFWQTDVETLTGVYNGIGPEQWPRYLRGIVTDLLVMIWKDNCRGFGRFVEEQRSPWNPCGKTEMSDYGVIRP